MNRLRYRFELAQAVVPKARPRFNNGQAYMPKRYRDWKNETIAQIIDQLPPDWEPLKECRIEIQLSQKRGDLDNLAGAVLDALVQARAIVDDRISVVTHLTVSNPLKKGTVVYVES